MNRCLRILLVLVLAGSAAGAAGAAEPLRVYAAASLTNALSEIAVDYERISGTRVILVFAASSALAAQIEHGAPADVFISADSRWMDYLIDKGRIVLATRRDVAGNDLVLIAPRGRGFKVEMTPAFDIAAAFTGKLCTGNTDAVPVGLYARQALTALGWWAALSPHIVGSEDVRAALAFVERGECAAGIVYATDAAISDKVEVVAAFPATTHDPIVYPAAVVRDAPGDGRAFLEALRSDTARAVFTRHGFRVESSSGPTVQ